MSRTRAEGGTTSDQSASMRHTVNRLPPFAGSYIVATPMIRSALHTAAPENPCHERTPNGGAPSTSN